MKVLKNSIKIIAFLLCAAVIFTYLSLLCERKTYDAPWNFMAKLDEFYALEKDSLDYVVVGSSHAYCTINPLEVWNDSGVAGFVLATPQQPLVASYHYIKEAFKTQSPKYVVLEGYMICNESTYDSETLYGSIDPLDFSINKLQMINNLVEFEKRPYYYFNLFKYHNRWDSLLEKDYKLVTDKPKDTSKGFVAVQGSFSGENAVIDYEKVKDIQLSEFNTKVLNDIYELIKENGAEMILMLGPYDVKSTMLCEMIKAEITWAKQKNIPVLDYCQMLDKLKIDPKTDYFDTRHLDVSGAVKTSKHFSDYLKERGAEKNTRIDEQKWRTDYNSYFEKFQSELK